MTYAILFRPQVEEDVSAAFAWYEDKVRDLGRKFLRGFYASTVEIPLNPFLYPKVYGEYRRCILGPFPYAVYYKVRGEEVVVAGVYHCARDPRAIRAELRERGRE